jgi:membrane-associated phospholipid phosphatase
MASLAVWDSDAVAQQAELAARTAIPSALPDAPVPSGGTPYSATDDLPLDKQPHAPVTIGDTAKHTITDLGHIAVSPLYIRTSDLEWMLPLAGASAAAFATDTRMMRDVVSTNPSFNQTAGNVSDGLRDGLIAVPVVMFGAGQMSNRPHLREAGILGGEGMIDALVVDEVVKLSTFRERPTVDNAQGEFYVGKSGGVNSSFVSGHAMIAWSSAAVISGEYKSLWKQIAVYAAAGGVSASRVMAQQHFPTDVLVGSAGGWLIGHFVYRAHHHADVTQ